MKSTKTFWKIRILTPVFLYDMIDMTSHMAGCHILLLFLKGLYYATQLSNQSRSQSRAFRELGQRDRDLARRYNHHGFALKHLFRRLLNRRYRLRHLGSLCFPDPHQAHQFRYFVQRIPKFRHHLRRRNPAMDLYFPLVSALPHPRHR